MATCEVCGQQIETQSAKTYFNSIRYDLVMVAPHGNTYGNLCPGSNRELSREVSDVQEINRV